MSCKERGFLFIRHNDLRDPTHCKYVIRSLQRRRNRTKINTVNGRRVGCRTANTTNEVRLDIGVHGFWERRQQAFLDLRVFDPNACRYLNKSLQQCHVMNEQEKKEIQ